MELLTVRKRDIEDTTTERHRQTFLIALFEKVFIRIMIHSKIYFTSIVWWKCGIFVFKIQPYWELNLHFSIMQSNATMQKCVEEIQRWNSHILRVWTIYGNDYFYWFHIDTCLIIYSLIMWGLNYVKLCWTMLNYGL